MKRQCIVCLEEYEETSTVLSKSSHQCKPYHAPVMAGSPSSEDLKFDKNKQLWFAMPLEVLAPLADVFAAGEKKYATFNCLQPFKDGSRRFYDGQMRHTMATQRDPLAIDKELKEQYGVEVFELAQVAFNALLRLYHARKEQEAKSLPSWNERRSSRVFTRKNKGEQHMNSIFLRLAKNDFIKGLIVSVVGATLGVIQPAIAAGTVLDPTVFRGALQLGLGAGVAYLTKNLFTNSQGKIGPEAVKLVDPNGITGA